jgi:hypothetical protein
MSSGYSDGSYGKQYHRASKRIARLATLDMHDLSVQRPVRTVRFVATESPRILRLTSYWWALGPQDMGSLAANQHGVSAAI